MMMSYEPLPDHNSLIAASSHASRLTERSQRPLIYLNPTDNVGGEMVLPFFYYNNWLDCSKTNFANMMGKINFYSASELESANGGTEPVTFTVFAWAEELELCVPTTLLPQCNDRLQAQAKSQRVKAGGHTEYEDQGAISKVATSIEAAAGKLTNTPVIGPFAMATKIGAGAVSSIAKIFGFSRPPILTNTSYFKPKHISDLATCDSLETVTKLTVDSKQEITLDPRTVGLSGEDELSLSVLAKKSTLLTTFLWATTDAADVQLFSIHVAPMLEQYLGFAEATHTYQPTTLSFITWPFANWSGSLKFRFQIVRSNFHNGRLQFVYDPEGGSTATAGEFNTVYNQIVDIAHVDDFEMEVAWTKDEPYLSTAWDKTATHWVAGATNLATNAFANGTLTVNVVNELNAPVNSADVEILVYVSAGDDFELTNPTERNIYDSAYNIRTFIPQSSDREIPVEITHPEEAPLVLNVNGKGDTNLADQKALIFYGEKIASFRTLLRRYNRYRMWSANTVNITENSILESECYQYMQPYTRGGYSGALDTTSAARPFSYLNFNLYSYLVPAYVGWRGSLRTKMSVEGHELLSGTVNRVYNPDLTRIGTKLNAFISTTRSDTHNVAKKYSHYGATLPSMMTGAQLQPLGLAPILEFEQPFASGKRFACAKKINSHESATNMDQMMFRTAVTTKASTHHTHMIIDQFHAVGEDFNVFFFLNAPVRLEYADPAP